MSAPSPSTGAAPATATPTGVTPTTATTAAATTAAATTAGGTTGTAPTATTATGRPSPGAVSSSTPRLLRWARGAAAAAALLTGIAATGTFSTDGVNATPNVIAGQWAAAQEASADIAQAEWRATQRLTAGAADEEAIADYDALAASVSADLSRMGDTSGAAAQEWSSFLTGVERAATGDADPADVSEAARNAARQADVVASAQGEDLLTGSRSVLTAVVGTASTLVLVAILVGLALRTRRIINIPLLVATLITAGLTYVSFNPGALPLNYDQRITETDQAVDTLRAVYQARSAGLTEISGGDEGYATLATQARAALEGLDRPELLEDWDAVAAATEAGDASGGEAAFATVQEQVEGIARDRLSDVAAQVSAPAVLTAGAALLLGLLGAALAWTGITQRLRDYR